MKNRKPRIDATHVTLLCIGISLLFLTCPQKPPDDARDMMISENMTKVVYHYGSVKPLLITVMDRGAVVKARETSDGWYKIWWFEKGKWKIGYVKGSNLVPVPDSMNREKVPTR